VFGKNREFFWKKVAGARFDPNTALSGRICVIFMDSNSGTRQRGRRFKFVDGGAVFPSIYILSPMGWPYGKVSTLQELPCMDHGRNIENKYRN